MPLYGPRPLPQTAADIISLPTGDVAANRLQEQIAELAAEKAALAGNNSFTGNNSISKLTLPNALRVQAYQNTAQSPLIAAQFTPIVYEITQTNKFSEMASSRFTALETGVYSFFGNIYYASATAITNWRILSRCNLNGVLYRACYENTISSGIRAAAPFSFSFVPMLAGSYLDIIGWSSAACTIFPGQAYTYFEAMRVG